MTDGEGKPGQALPLEMIVERLTTRVAESG
jgi:hypothetical protein